MLEDFFLAIGSLANKGKDPMQGSIDIAQRRPLNLFVRKTENTGVHKVVTYNGVIKGKLLTTNGTMITGHVL